MGLFGALLLLGLFIFITSRLIKKLVWSIKTMHFYILLSVVLYYINSIMAGIAVFGLVGGFLFEWTDRPVVSIAVGAVIGIFTCRLLMYFGHSGIHPRLEYMFRFIMGIVDGVFIGYLIDSYYLPKHYNPVLLSYRISAYVFCIAVAMVMVFKARGITTEDMVQMG